MKKRLAMLLSVAMAFSMFANVAFGADATLTTTQKYEALVEAGIFNGIPGSTDPQLNVQTDRAQFAKILALTTGLEQVTGVTTFKDNGYATNWAKGYIEAVVKAGYMNGVGGEKFNLTGKITGEQMAKSFAVALGLEEVKDAAAIDGVSAWATGWVTAIKEAGFDFSMDGKWNTPVTRAVLIDAAYAVREQVGVTVESTTIIDEKTVEVTFSDKEVVKVTLDKALVQDEATTVEVKHSNGQTFKVEVTLKALAIEAKATGASKLTVDFNRAIDTSKAAITVKRGSSSVTVKSTVYNDNNTAAVITLGNKLVEGEYTVTVSGVSAEAVTATVKAEAEKIESVELLGDTAAATTYYDGFTVAYQALNQYGEDASSIASINWTASKGTVSESNGVLTVTGPAGNYDPNVSTTSNQYAYNETVVLTGVENNTYKVTTKTYKIGLPAQAATVEFGELYNADNATLTTSSTFGDFYALLTVKDQYGNKLNKTQIADSLKLVSGNPTIANIESELVTNAGPNADSLAIRLAAPSSTANYRFTGDVTISAIALGSGQTFTKTINVATGSELAKFTLSQPDTVATNDSGVKIPFTAYDNSGNELTAFSDVYGAVTIDASKGEVKILKDYETGKAYVNYVPDANGGVAYTDVIYAVVPGTANTSQITLNVKKAAVPTVMTGTSATTSVGVRGTFTLNSDNLTIQDQYGRDYDYATAVKAGYYVGLTASSLSNITSKGLFTVTNSGATVLNGALILDNVDATLTFTGEKQGTQPVELALYNNGSVVSSSSVSFNANVVTTSAITEYVVEDVGTVFDYTGATEASVSKVVYGSKVSDYAKKIVVYGKKADGSKVVLGTDEYTINADSSAVTVDQSTKKIVPVSNVITDNDGKDVTTKISVVINSADTATTVTKEVTLSKALPAAQSLSTDTDFTSAVIKSVSSSSIKVNATGGTLNVAELFKAIEMKDQYGITNYVADEYVTASITNVSNSAAKVAGNGTNAAVISGLSANDTFVVTITTKNQASIKLTVGVAQ